MLLEWGSSANDSAQDGNTPLHLACEHGHFDVVCTKHKLLIYYVNNHLLIIQTVKTYKHH